MENLLEIEDLTIKYGDKKAVSNVSFNLEQGKILAIIGESGSGKTTLLRAIGGLLPETASFESQKMGFSEADIASLKKSDWNKIHGMEIGTIFQNPEKSLSPLSKIKNQFWECMKVFDPKISKALAYPKSVQMLKNLHFDDPERVLNSYPFELSGGMCQRIAIGLAIINNPALLLADEPTSALDVSSQKTTIETLMELRQKYNTSILIVTHNIGVAAKMADFIGVMYQGRLVEYATKSEVIKHPRHEYTKKLIDAVPRV